MIVLRLSGYQVAECKCANGKSTGAAPGLQPKMFTFTQVIGFDRNLVQSTPIAIIYSQPVHGNLLTDPCLCSDVVKPVN